MAVPAELLDAFAERFGEKPRVFSAPGRVNLIGEHTDYNDGFVLPMALDRRTYVAARLRSDRSVLVRSLNQSEEHYFDLDDVSRRRTDSWLDYARGVAEMLRVRGVTLKGVDLMLWSNVPLGAGLSSSAALEVALGYAFARMAGDESPDLVKLALAGQAAEHEYVGILCGIMDQFAAALSREGSALLIDCRSLEARAIPLRLGSACLLICDTHVKHELVNSEYNERRAQCMQGVALLKRLDPSIEALRDADAEKLAHADLPEPIARRCRHVVTENQRTLAAAEALAQGRLNEVGELMLESHASLRDDYEVSCRELDEAVAAASGQQGVYGARMTGGGFGGCTVTLLEREAVPAVSARIERRFAEIFGTRPTFLVSEACGGAREDAV